MGAAQDPLGQLWKEYALSDSRYMTSDTLVLCMETITVVSWKDRKRRMEWAVGTDDGSSSGDRSALVLRPRSSRNTLCGIHCRLSSV